MKKTERVQLSSWHKVDHYFIVVFLLLMPIWTTYDLVRYYLFDEWNAVISPSELAEGSYIWIIPAIVFAFIQWKRLDFKKFRITATKEEVDSALQQTIEDLNWYVESKTPTFIRAYRDWDLTASWGEMITIIINKDSVLVNSICDPNKHTSVASWGMNKTNVRTFVINLYNSVNGTSIKKPEEYYNKWSLSNNLFRIIAYPFCLGLVLLALLGFIPNGDYELGILSILLVAYYFYTDLS